MAINKLGVAIFMIDKLGFVAKSIEHSKEGCDPNNEAAEREVKKTIPFTIAPKIVKYLGINLTEEVKDLYSENYKYKTVLQKPVL